MMSLRLRLAALVTLASLVVLSMVGAVLVATVSSRLHATARSDALEAVERAVESLTGGTSADVITRVAPGMPVVQVGYTRPGVGTDRPPPLPTLRLDGADELIGGALRSDGERRPAGPVDRDGADDVAGLLDGLDPGQVPRPGESLVVERDIGDAEVYQAMASAVDGAGGIYTVAAAVPLTETRRTVAALRVATIVVVPVVAVLLGILAAVITGRALRPVARMRSEADAISHGTLHHRLTPAARSAELAGLARTMNQMLDRIERSATSQRQLVSDVSHELRSPLATIRGTVELAVGRPDTIAESGPVALAEIDRLNSLVGDLLLLARLEEGGGEHEEVDLDDVVRSQIATVGPTAPSVDASAVAAVRVVGDRRALTGMVRNLLDNAVRHARRWVVVSLVEERGTVRLVVADDGPGVPVEQRERIFDRFARIDDARSRDTGGTGLGLAVAGAAARAHGGTIRVEDADGGGARFVVELSPG